MTWVQPFDILLKYKGQAGVPALQQAGAGGVAGDKIKTGLATPLVTNPVKSQMWNEIVTYFKSKFIPQ